MGLFKKKVESVPLAPVEYPSDLFVATEKGVYFIKGKYRLPVFSDRALASWNTVCVRSSEAAVSGFKPGPPLGFRNGTLVKSFSDNKIYLISDNKRRHVVSPDAFARYGLDESKAVLVSRDEINLHPEGEVLA